MLYENYPYPMKDFRPFSHQKETTEFILKNKRGYILNDIGTGKSLCPLWAFDFLYQNKKVRKMLIISPLSTLRVVWGKEIFTHFPHLRYAIAHGNNETRVRAIQSDAHFVIINHDGIKSVEDVIIKEGFDIVLIDELTAYKNATSDRSKCMQRIARKVRAVYGMTGTPTPNSPTEAFGQCRIVNPENPYLPKYFTKFRQMVETEIAPFVYIAKPEAKDIVYRVMQPAIRFERDKCIDIPENFTVDIELPMSVEQKVVYDKISKELLYEYENKEISAVNAAVKWSKLLQVSAGSVKDDQGGLLHLNIDQKIENILETFDELGKTKLIVVSAFKASVERLTKIFKEEKIRCEFIYGDVNMNERTKIINAFQGGDLQIVVVQPQAVSHGITLTAANTIIWQSYVASGEVYGQFNGRITRAGQTRKQYVRRLICSKAEKRISQIILDGKMDLSKSVLDMFAENDL